MCVYFALSWLLDLFYFMKDPLSRDINSSLFITLLVFQILVYLFGECSNYYTFFLIFINRKSH